jgi:phage terminase small subunit
MLLDPNVTRAAIAAGYSKTVANTAAYQWVREVDPLKPHVVAELERLRARIARKVEASAERIVEELTLIGHADIGDIVDLDHETGVMSIRRLDGMTPRERRAICKITQTRTERYESRGKDGEPPDLVENIKISVEMHSKTAALRMLMDHLGMDAPKRSELTGKNGGPIEQQLSGLPAKELLELYAKARKDAEESGE